MPKKGQMFHSYSEEFKRMAVKRYVNGSSSYNTISKELGLQSSTQLKNWVQKHKNGETFTDMRGKSLRKDTPVTGRQKTNFKSIEEERDYYKAQVAYLKKRYPNLHGEEKLKKE